MKANNDGCGECGEVECECPSAPRLEPILRAHGVPEPVTLALGRLYDEALDPDTHGSADAARMLADAFPILQEYDDRNQHTQDAALRQMGAD